MESTERSDRGCEALTQPTLRHGNLLSILLVLKRAKEGSSPPEFVVEFGVPAARTETPRSFPPCPAAQSNASLRSPPASSHQSPPAFPSAAHDRPAIPVPSRTPRDACPDQSGAASVRSSSDPESSRPALSPQTAAAPVNPPSATRSCVRHRCLRNTQSAANGSKFPASATAAPALHDKTVRTAPPRTRQSALPPAPRSAVHKMDARELLPAPPARSTCLPASHGHSECPWPCAHSMNYTCGSFNYFSRNPHFNHGLLGMPGAWERG
jgi:hypothetical protein